MPQAETRQKRQLATNAIKNKRQRRLNMAQMKIMTIRNKQGKTITRHKV